MTDPSGSLRLRWRRTWPDREWPAGIEHDFVATLDRPRGYCRIYFVIGGPQGGRWQWNAATWYAAGAGTEPTAREAAAAAEGALFARLRREADEAARSETAAKPLTAHTVNESRNVGTGIDG